MKTPPNQPAFESAPSKRDYNPAIVAPLDYAILVATLQRRYGSRRNPDPVFFPEHQNLVVCGSVEQVDVVWSDTK